MNIDVFKSIRPKDYYKELLIRKIRGDGRQHEEIRPLVIETGAIKTADASSLIRCGDTTVICGCILKLCQINSTVPLEFSQALNITLQLSPIATNNSQLPQHAAQIYTKKLINILKDASIIDTENLIFKTDPSQFWTLDIEVVFLTYDGNLVGSALEAILSTLESLVETRQSDFGRNILLNARPVGIAFAVIDDNLLFDPTPEEEAIASSTLLVVVDAVSKNILRLDKTGGFSLTDSILFQCLNQTFKLCNLINKHEK